MCRRMSLGREVTDAISEAIIVGRAEERTPGLFAPAEHSVVVW